MQHKYPQTTKNNSHTWQAGVAFALAEVWRLHQEDIVVKDVMKSSGLTVEDLRVGAADPYDYEAVEEAIKSAS